MNIINLNCDTLNNDNNLLFNETLFEIKKSISLRIQGQSDKCDYEEYWQSFLENYFTWLGKETDIDIETALYYLNAAYPYCMFSSNFFDYLKLDEALMFYTKYHLNLDIDLGCLKNLFLSKTTSFDFMKFGGNCSYIDTSITFGDISGSLISLYQKKNLYDVLVQLEDRCVSSFISYIALNDALREPKKIMIDQKPFIYQNEIGENYVVEGNHRIFIGAALSILEKLANPSYEPNYFPVTIQKCR